MQLNLLYKYYTYLISILKRRLIVKVKLLNILISRSPEDLFGIIP